MTGSEKLRERTKKFALAAIKLSGSLPNNITGQVIKRQLIRAGSSVGANYRAAKRAKSAADFVFKLGIVEEEVDEAMYWMELAVEAGLLKKNKIADLYQEADEILAMVVSSIKTARRKKK